jgi:hypothetical protein
MTKLIWGEGEEAAVVDVDELDALLDRLTLEAEHGRPFIAELVADDGSTLSIGLGRPLTVVNYVPASLDPPYFQSMGRNGSDDALVFLYGGEWSEYPPRSAVPMEQARRAMRQFFKTQSLPDAVEWEEM